MEIVLLLTATINPGNFHFVGRKGVSYRHDEYLNAVKFYSKFGIPIVFIDNSNFFSSEISGVISNIDNSQYLHFSSAESHKGKGHGELEILKYGLDNSTSLQNSNYIVKISGRYLVTNFKDFYLHLHSFPAFHYCNYSRNFSWVDTRIMILDQLFIKRYLIPVMDKFLDENKLVFFEKVYARSIHLYQYDGGKVLLWPRYPYYRAVNGQNGKSINFSYFKKIKYFIYYELKKFVFKQTI